MKALIRSDNNFAGLVLRLTLGFVILPHGAQKLLGWFGGHGFQGTMDFFTGQGMPGIIAFLVIIGESVGALSLIAGFLTRFCAFGIAIIMLGAIQLVHLKHGFFMNWHGAKSGEGFEFHILALGICCALFLTGGGRWSVDAWLSREGKGR